MLKIAVLLLYTEGWKDIYDIVAPNLDAYCRKYNYRETIYVFREPSPSDLGYKKLEIIRTLFDEGYEIVWSRDADLLITNLNLKIEDFLDNEHDFFICKDVNGINGGSFCIKNTEWSNEFLKKCLEYKGQPGMHCEQNAFEKFIEVYGQENIKILPHPSINSLDYSLYIEHKDCIGREDIGDWQPKNFVIHLPGLGLNDRIELLKEFKEKVIE